MFRRGGRPPQPGGLVRDIVRRVAGFAQKSEVEGGDASLDGALESLTALQQLRPPASVARALVGGGLP